MRADADLRQDTRYPMITAVPRGHRGMGDALLQAAMPSAAPVPAQIRALAFAASLGPAMGPRTVAFGPEAEDVVIDLAGEEAFLSYLARVADPV